MAALLGRLPPACVVPDEILSAIDELELVDCPPADVLLRIRQSAILTPAELAEGLQGELRPAVLALLRESALRTIADQADRQLLPELSPAGGSPPEVKGRIVVCVPPRAGLEERIRRSADYARARTRLSRSSP